MRRRVDRAATVSYTFFRSVGTNVKTVTGQSSGQASSFAVSCFWQLTGAPRRESSF